MAYGLISMVNDLTDSLYLSVQLPGTSSVWYDQNEKWQFVSPILPNENISKIQQAKHQSAIMTRLPFSPSHWHLNSDKQKKSICKSKTYLK